MRAQYHSCCRDVGRGGVEKYAGSGSSSRRANVKELAEAEETAETGELAWMQRKWERIQGNIKPMQ
jgi:hypothetical protein